MEIEDHKSKYSPSRFQHEDQSMVVSCCSWLCEIFRQHPQTRKVEGKCEEYEWCQCILPLFSMHLNPNALEEGMWVSGLLLLFQCLGECGGLLRQSIGRKGQLYHVRVWQGFCSRLVWVDGTFPYTASAQPLFLSLPDQMWPMVLHKALIKHYGGNLALSEVPINQLLQTLTGSCTFSLPMPASGKAAGSILSTIWEEGAIVLLLNGNQCPFQRKQQKWCRVLEVTQGHVMVNAGGHWQTPEWETMEQKVGKIHYLSPHTTPFWISHSQLPLYFPQMVFCHVKGSPKPKMMGVSSQEQTLYLRAKGKRSKNKSPLELSLMNSRYEGVVVKKACAWVTQEDRLHLVEVNTLGTAALLIDNRDFFILLEIPHPLHGYLKYDCGQAVDVQVLEGLIGQAEAIERWKKYFQEAGDNGPVVQEVGAHLLVMVRSDSPSYILGYPFTESHILEGILTGRGQVQMFVYHDIRFALLTHIQSPSMIQVLTHHNQLQF